MNPVILSEMKVSCPKCRTENSEDSKFCRECATPLPSVEADRAETVTAGAPLPRLEPGSTFAGRYSIIEEIGHGGMGRVYKAYDTKIREKVALKLVRPEISSDGTIVERFANEIRLARRITHRNVCRVHDLGEEQGTPYITMEYVSGEDLKSMLRMTGGLSPGQTIAIGRQIAAGLAEAHRLGVVHRDLKPHNVMIDREGTARIMDFGIAYSARTKGLTDRGAMIGTPEYMSPEQAEGDEVDACSDIYSLGVMLFEMATGRLPFEGRTALALAMKHKAEPPPDPSTVSPRVPPELSLVILRCLAKEKGARYQSADEVRAELERIGGESPTPALPQGKASTGGTPTAFAWRRVLVPAAVVLFIVVAGIVAWRLVPRHGLAPAAPPRVSNSIVVVGFDNQTGDARFDHLRKAIPNLIITSLENTGRFKVVTWERMRDVLSQAGRKDVDVIDSEGGFDVCRREGVAFIVTGSFTKAGDFFATDVKVLNAESRALVKSASSRGEGENSILRTQIDEIGRQIARSLAPAEDAAPRVTSIMDVTTGSMEAYSAYLRGSAEYERLYYEGAIKELKTAIEIDPQFASARLMLASAYNGQGDRKARNEEIRLARQHAAKATERERLSIDAKYAIFIEGDPKRQIAILKVLVNRYPQDKKALFDLALAYSSMAMPKEAATAFEQVLALDPNYGLALNSLGFVYFDLGKFDLAVQCLEKYAAVSPNDANPLDSLAALQVRLGRLNEAMASYKRALAIQPDFGSDSGLALVAALKEDFDSAFRWIDSYIERAPQTWKAEGYGFRAVLFQLTGRPSAARAELAKCREIKARAGTAAQVDRLSGWIEYDNQAWTTSRRDFQRLREAWAKMGRNKSGDRAILDILAATVDRAEKGRSAPRLDFERLRAALASQASRNNADIDLKLRQLQAAELAADGKLDEAIAILTPAWPGPQPNDWTAVVAGYYYPLAQDDLARLYVLKKDWDRAIAEYKTLTVIGPAHMNRRLVHPIYHYRLAQVYEQKGMKAEATAEYQRFVKLWANAEGQRPELQDARRRLQKELVR